MDSEREFREWRRERRMARRFEKWGGAPVGALVLLAVGAVLLAQNLGMDVPQRWWSFLLLIPAAGALVAAMRHYRDSGIGADFVGSVVSTTIFVLLWGAFFFEIGWSIFWPILLIGIGAALLVRDYWPRNEGEPPA